MSSETVDVETQCGSGAAGADVSNQASLATLGIPSVDDLGEAASAGLDWLGQAMAGTDSGLDVQGGMLGFIADGLGLTNDEGEYDNELVNELMLDHDLEFGLAVAWATAIAEGRVGDKECWNPLQRVLLDFKPHADSAADVLVAIDLLLSAEANNQPADALRHFADIYEAMTCFMPYVPVMTEFITVFGEVLGNAANRLDELARSLRLKDSKVPGIFQDGAYSGRRPLTNYLKTLRRQEDREPSDGVVEWVMANIDGLSFATGERPPAEKREVFGVDFLAADEIDLAALLVWFQQHLWAVARYVWGDEVDEMWGSGE